MLHDFTYYNPTKIYFGKNSIKKIGLYDEVVRTLQACGKNVFKILFYIIDQGVASVTSFIFRKM